jgi:DNA polymerase I-like protein with 3'-5' exonuclease and polymerase domains
MVHIKPREVLDEKKDRGAAKVGNFSSAYGASASTLERKIEQDTGKKPEEGTGQRLLKALEKRQPVAQDFLIKMERIPEKPGYYRAASGRIRHFSSHDPKYLDDIDEHLTMGLFKSMGREARNFPMQESVAATAARAGKWLLDTYIKLNMQARPLIILYDSVVTLCPLEERFKVAQMHQLFMTDENTWEYHGRKMNYPIDTDFVYRWSAKPDKADKKLLEDKTYKAK